MMNKIIHIILFLIAEKEINKISKELNRHVNAHIYFDKSIAVALAKFDERIKSHESSSFPIISVKLKMFLFQTATIIVY